jgi:hypothetical protein
LSSFDVTKIKINKKVKDFYDSLTLYHSSNEEVYVPIVIEPLTEERELTEEKYDDENEEFINNVKIIKL